MTITVVTRWRTPDVAESTRIAKEAKALWMRRGATDVRLNMLYTGADAGQWIFAVVFKDWEAFGKAVSGAAETAEFQRLIAANAKVGAAMLEREILVGTDL